jgi:enoyl-CoA hydratase/carnithine racemase
LYALKHFMHKMSTPHVVLADGVLIGEGAGLALPGHNRPNSFLVATER